jgi:hypothetical protein
LRRGRRRTADETGQDQTAGDRGAHKHPWILFKSGVPVRAPLYTALNFPDIAPEPLPFLIDVLFYLI